MADEVQVGAESYEIDVRLAARDRDGIGDLDDFTVTAPGGAQVPLGTVAIVEPGRGQARIHRIDGRRTVSVQGEIDTGQANLSEVLGRVEKDYMPGFRKLYPDIKVSFEGEMKSGNETLGSVRETALVGLVGIFLLLSFQFKSYIEPVIVLLTNPLSFIGVVWGHMAMGLDLSMPSMVGFAALSGVVVNDSILLVQFIKG